MNLRILAKDGAALHSTEAVIAMWPIDAVLRQKRTTENKVLPRDLESCTVYCHGERLRGLYCVTLDDVETQFWWIDCGRIEQLGIRISNLVRCLDEDSTGVDDILAA
jgi:hypothetical protein